MSGSAVSTRVGKGAVAALCAPPRANPVAESPQWFREGAGVWEPYDSVVNAWLERAVSLVLRDQERLKAATDSASGRAPKLGPPFEMTQGCFLEPECHGGSLPYFNGYVVISRDSYVSLSDMKQYAMSDDSGGDKSHFCTVRRMAGRQPQPPERIVGKAEPKPEPMRRRGPTWWWWNSKDWQQYPDAVSARLEEEVARLHMACARQAAGLVREGERLSDGCVPLNDGHVVSLKDMQQYVPRQPERWRTIKRTGADGSVLNDMKRCVQVPRSRMHKEDDTEDHTSSSVQKEGPLKQLVAWLSC